MAGGTMPVSHTLPPTAHNNRKKHQYRGPALERSLAVEWESMPLCSISASRNHVEHLGPDLNEPPCQVPAGSLTGPGASAGPPSSGASGHLAYVGDLNISDRFPLNLDVSGTVQSARLQRTRARSSW